MNRRLKIAFLLLILFGVVSIGAVFWYSADIAVLSPKGMIAEKQSSLLLVATLIMLFVVVPVFVLTFFICWKYRASNKKAKYSPEWDNSHLAEAIWWGIPLVIIVILGVITWTSCHELDPFRPIRSDVKPVRIQVVALQWKWLFIYPEQEIATVNYVRFPEKTPVNFEITADAPMNSFWIPDLAGQVYAMPGMRAKLHLMANEEGSYRGSSANLSGEGFSGMTFIVESSSQEDFDAWVASVSQSSPGLEYSELLKPTTYNPQAFYVLKTDGLFDSIMMKYMMPMSEK